MKRATIINEEGLFEKVKKHPNIDFNEKIDSAFSSLWKENENNLERYLSGISTEELEKELERRRNNQ
ncbi:MAG: hypothetical protein HFJ42_07495 [Clostridia bacterium]|nr:hypothetical protein [Clostridia bacterium]